MTDQPSDLPPKRTGVDPEDVRRALDDQAKRRPPRPPVRESRPPIPRLRVDKPHKRRRKP